MLTFTAAVAIWVLLAAVIIAATCKVTSKRWPSPDGADPEEFVFDIEDYQWQDVA